MPAKEGFKCGYIAIIGPPNVGKSTLINRLLGTSLSPVSHKPQFTIDKLLGIRTGENYQMLFLDTPGVILKPRDELQRLMKRRVGEVIKEVDVILFMIEPRTEKTIDLIENEIKRVDSPVILIINKIDKVKKDILLPLIEYYSKKEVFKEIIPISVLKDINIDSLIEMVVKLLPESEPLFPSDVLTDKSERFFVRELIRREIYELLKEEVPFSSAVSIEEFIERKEAEKDYIKAIVYVEKDSQRGIVIGKGGRTLKEIGRRARREIETFLGRPVFLELRVKTLPKWRKNQQFLRNIRY